MAVTEAVLREELLKEARSKSRLGYLPQVLTLGVSIFAHYRTNPALTYGLSVVFMLVGALVRFFAAELVFKKRQYRKSFENLLALGFFFNALAWGSHFYSIDRAFGPGSSQIDYTLLIIIGIILMGSVSLVSSRRVFYTFLSTVLASVCFTYLSDEYPKNDFFVIPVAMFYVFVGTYYWISHLDLLSTLTIKIKATDEEGRFRDLVEAVPGYVSVIDQNMVYLEANNLTLKLMPDIIGKPVGFYNKDPDFIMIIVNFLTSQKTIEAREIMVVVNGESKYFLLSLKRTEKGGAFIILIPLDELAQARQELREKEAIAQYSAKLASLGQMAASVAHEVNNPLAIIYGSSVILEKLVDKEPLDKENIKLFSSKMVETCDRISKIIRSLKNLSRSGENDPFGEVSFKKVISECLDVSNQNFKKHQIELRLPDPEIDFHFPAKEAQLGQVFLNLLGNAIDATKNLKEKWVRVEIEKTDTHVKIYFIDSGKGIPPLVAARMMDPFYTTKDVNQGTGLGLSISKTIMRDHQGSLEYLPEKPNTTFRISIPLERSDY